MAKSEHVNTFLYSGIRPYNVSLPQAGERFTVSLEDKQRVAAAAVFRAIAATWALLDRVVAEARTSGKINHALLQQAEGKIQEAFVPPGVLSIEIQAQAARVVALLSAQITALKSGQEANLNSAVKH